MSVFLAVVVTIWTGLHLYVGQRLITAAKLSEPYTKLGWALLLAHLIFGMVMTALSRSSVALPAHDLLNMVHYTLMGAFALLFGLVVMRDLAELVLTIIQRVSARVAAPSASSSTAPPSPRHDSPLLNRRSFITGASSAGLLVTTAAGASFGFREARRVPGVEHVKLKVPGLHPDLEGFRIVQISDLHIGPTLKRDFLHMVVDRVNELTPDVVALTGDMVDGHVQALRPELADLQRVMATHGTFYVLGNHEYYWDGGAWAIEGERMGMRTLLNAHQVVKHRGAKVLVAGVTDYSQGRRGGAAASPTEAIRGAPPTDFRLLLAHQPRGTDEAAAVGFDLQLSGHTHGGQFFPWSFFVGLAHKFSRGLHKITAESRNMWLYVSRGTGYWGPPLRLGAPSEITLIELERA